MDEKWLLLKYVDDLTMISLRLGKLHSVIESISMGMEREDMEQQAIDSIDCENCPGTFWPKFESGNWQKCTKKVLKHGK